MIQDFKFAVRQLFKAPGFTIAAVIVLALGIGANTAVFSLVHTLFFAPPAYAKPTEVVQVFSQDKKNPKTYRGFSYPTYRDIREQNTVFTDAMAYNLALVGIGPEGRYAARVRRHCQLELFFRARRSAGTGSRVFAGRRNTRTRRGGGDRQLRLLAETQSTGARVAVAHQRPSFQHRRRRASRVHRHAADFFAGSLAAAERLRSGAKRFSKLRQKTVFGDRAGQQLLIIGRLKPGMTGAGRCAVAQRIGREFGKSISGRTKRSDVPNGGGVAYFREHESASDDSS